MPNSATLLQALGAAFCAILCALSGMGGGGMMIGARTAAWAKSGVQNLWVWPTGWSTHSGSFNPSSVFTPQVGVWYGSVAASGYIQAATTRRGSFTSNSVSSNSVGGYCMASFLPVGDGSFVISGKNDVTFSFSAAFYEILEGGSVKYIRYSRLNQHVAGSFSDDLVIPEGQMVLLVFRPNSGSELLTITDLDIRVKT